MTQARSLAAVLALGALTALPGCSMFGGNGGGQYTQTTAPAASTAPSSSASEAPAQQPQQQVALSPQLIRRVQVALRHDHLYRGHIDGKWGPMTQHAVTQYQQRQNLETTGRIDAPTLQALNLMPAGNQGGMGAGPMGNAGPNGGMGNAGPNSGMNNTGAGGSGMQPGAGGMQSGGTQGGSNMNYTPGGQGATGSASPGATPGAAGGATNPGTGGETSGTNPASTTPNQTR